MSLLKEAGHSLASKYPIWKVMIEADLVHQRKDREAALTASLSHLAVAAGMGSKKAAKAFEKRIKTLTRT